MMDIITMNNMIEIERLKSMNNMLEKRCKILEEKCDKIKDELNGIRPKAKKKTKRRIKDE